MSRPDRRQTRRPDPRDLDELAADTALYPGRLRKAAPVDPVIDLAHADDPDTRQPSPLTEATPVKSRKEKVGFYQAVEDADRARAAFMWTRTTPDGQRSFSDFIARAVMCEVNRLETEYNSGLPWSAMCAGELPTGKPLRST